MTIGSIGSASAYQPIQRMPETSEVKSGAADNDGDTDDGATSRATSQTVNTLGQTIGQLISTVA